MTLFSQLTLKKTLLFFLLGLSLFAQSAFAVSQIKIEAWLNSTGSERQEIVDGDQRVTTPGLNFGLIDGNSARIKRYTITNTGNEALRVTMGDNQPQTNSPDMTVEGFFGTTFDFISAGQSQDFRIIYRPTVSTTIAEFTLNSDSDVEGQRPFTFFLVGNGRLGEAHAFYDPSNGNPDREIPYQDTTPTQSEGTHFGTLDIGTGPENNPNIVRNFKFTNQATGVNSELKITSAEITGTGRLAFQLFNLNSTTIESGDSSAFQIKFDPSEEGTHDAELSVNTNDPDRPNFTFALRGIGKVTPVMMVSGSQTANGTFRNIVDGDDTPSINDGTLFFQTQVGNERTTFFKVTNTGSGPLEFIDPELLGNDTFDVVGFPHDPVAPGETHDFSITFRPPSPEEHSSSFAIRTNEGPVTLFTFLLRGTGLSPLMQLEGEGPNGTLKPVADDPTANPLVSNGTDLETLIHRDSAVLKRFLITNTGNDDLTITGSQIIADGASLFNTQGLPIDAQSPPVVLMSGQTHEFFIHFNPARLGVQFSTIRINHDAPDTRYEFQVRANVTGVADISIAGRPEGQEVFTPIAPNDSSPSPGDGTAFPDTDLETTSTSTFRITNSGSGDLELAQAPKITGTHRDDFVVQNYDSSAMGPGETRIFTIIFSPKEEGEHTAEFSLESSDPDTLTYVFALSGTGKTPEEEPDNGLPPNRISSIVIENNQATITFFAEEGKRFALTYNTDLSPKRWVLVPGFDEIVGSSEPQTIIVKDFIDPNEPKMYFRIQEL